MNVLTTKEALGAANKTALVEQVLFAQQVANDHQHTINAIELAVNAFAADNFKNGIKPKKLLWWTVLNINSVIELVKTIIKLIKDLRDKYESDTTERN
jgi:hypothetical protein